MMDLRNIIASFKKKKAVKKTQKKILGDEAMQKKGIVTKFDKKIKKDVKKRHLHKILVEFLEKAGYDVPPKRLNQKVIYVDLVINVLATFVVLIVGLLGGAAAGDIILLILLLWTILLVGLYALSLVVMFIYLDMRIANRTQQIEEVF